MIMRLFLYLLVDITTRLFLYLLVDITTDLSPYND